MVKNLNDHKVKLLQKSLEKCFKTLGLSKKTAYDKFLFDDNYEPLQKSKQRITHVVLTSTNITIYAYFYDPREASHYHTKTFSDLETFFSYSVNQKLNIPAALAVNKKAEEKGIDVTKDVQKFAYFSITTKANFKRKFLSALEDFFISKEFLQLKKIIFFN